MKNEACTMREALPIIQSRLAAGLSVSISPQGTSMQPMLYGGRDSVVLSPVPGRCKKNDVILYVRPNGQFVLHRIIALQNQAYVCRGDHQFIKEFSVPHQNVLAVVTAFTRNGQYTETSCRTYRLYCWLWPSVHMALRLLATIKRRLHRLFKMKICR